MTDQELTLDQLQTIAGGPHIRNFETGFTAMTTRGIRDEDQALMPSAQKMKAVEIGVPPEPKLWFKLLG